MSRLIAAAAAVLMFSGCMSVKLPAPQAQLDSVVLLRDSGISPVSVGNFALSADKKPAIDKSASARGSTIAAESGSFSTYLRDTLISDLKAAGKYVDGAATSIEGELAENTLNAAATREASATLAARFKVRKGGDLVYNKVIVQQAKWPSSFVGAIAIPDAFNHFGDQFRLILLQLYKDAEFQRVLKPVPR